ncbi:MAG: histidinol dehydrogenase [Desulfobacterales bacterium]|jgi:histidinol dehydrogenase|nr:histidinol dehydrogenase [Desulfobacterales bacterium]
MKTYVYPSREAEKRLGQITGRSLAFQQKDLQAVRRILADVQKGGDAALIQYVNRFDAPHLTPHQLRVGPDEIRDAAGLVDPAFVRALNRARRQIEVYHRQQAPRSWIDTPRPGTLVGQLVRPVDAAGIYVPGGKAGATPLVSSVLMGAVPARIAGVKRLVMATPPRADGGIDPHLLVAARDAGIEEIYRVGSAWGIAALAYGTETIPRVETIVGPGNIYVTLAKKLVAGTVGIDMIAGPSEILVIADGSADPDAAAADLLSQAEHDPLASAVLVTDHRSTARAVAASVERQLAALPRGEIAAASLKHYGAILVVPDLDTAIDLANRIAPEHLELLVAEPFSYLGAIRNAGAVFLGSYTPEPVGDYIAGPNHVLPTAGTARFSSALSVDHFTKKTSVIHYNRAAFENEADDIVRLAEVEGLEAHARAIRVRQGKK